MFPLRLCEGKLLVAVTRERRYGPSRLRINDDDDVWKLNLVYTYSMQTQQVSAVIIIIIILFAQ